jgi:polysaccharide pyruvyl transferase WcaK-like protein
VRRVALFGYLGSGNIGNDATFETVLAWLRSTQPDVEVRCITIAPEEIIARYGVPSVPLAWHSSRRGSNRLMRALRKMSGRLLDVPRSFALAGSVDAVIVPGMGVLEKNLRVGRLWGLPSWQFLIAVACRVRGRRFVLLDVGAERATNPLTRGLHVVTAELASHVSYRDSLSAVAMRRAGARAPELVAPDLVFAHPAPTRAEPEPGLLVVGVMAYYGPTDNAIRGANVLRRYVATMASALARFTDAGDRLVLVGGDRVDVDIARDVRAAVLAMRPRLPHDVVVVREFTTFAELTEQMMRAEVVIASRFHNLICALRLARPTISVGYARKSRHLMETLGLGSYCQDIEHLNADELVAQVLAARNAAWELANRIRLGTASYAAEVESLLERVATEALGLAAWPSRPSRMKDEIEA